MNEDDWKAKEAEIDGDRGIESKCFSTTEVYFTYFDTKSMDGCENFPQRVDIRATSSVGEIPRLGIRECSRGLPVVFRKSRDPTGPISRRSWVNWQIGIVWGTIRVLRVTYDSRRRRRRRRRLLVVIFLTDIR